MIRVLVVDDHRVVRAGLETLLDVVPDIELVGAAPDGAHAVQLAAELRPDVILMDLSMPVMDGVEATRRILGANPEQRIVVLTSFADQRRVIEAIDAGANGYILKDAAPEALLDAIRAAAEGGAPLDPRVAPALLAQRRAQTNADLTDRELEVLRLVGQGLLNKQIARRLDISEKTVKTHLTSVFRRLGVTDRTQAALWAERNGLVGG